jgi:hypothetical protein
MCAAVREPGPQLQPDDLVPPGGGIDAYRASERRFMSETAEAAGGGEPTLRFAKDGTITWVGDANQRGTDVYWSDRLQMWVFVDLENKRVEMARRFLIARTPPGESGAEFNQICLTNDRDGECRTWVISIDDEASRQNEDTLEFVFDSRSLE